MRLILLLCMAMALCTDLAAAPTAWSAGHPDVAARVADGQPLVVHVTIPLCSNAQIDCGSRAAGAPGNPRTNLYWGAIFGAKTIFERKASGWEAVAQASAVEGVLERAVFRRWVDGDKWGRNESVEQLVVLDAIHGDHIDAAVLGFFAEATEGAEVQIDDGERERRLRVSAAGYAGHNRLMDDLTLPEKDDHDGRAVAAFVMACRSAPYFSEALREAGSTPLVMTRTLMAPEGYVVEAAARGLGDNLPPPGLRSRVVWAYARWQRIEPRLADRVFAR